MKKILATIAALAGMGSAPVVQPVAPTPPAVITDTRVRQRVVKPFRASPPTPKAVAARIIARDKRAAKRAYRAARRAGRPITWTKAHERGALWRFLMSGGTRATWASVHERATRGV